MTSKTFSPLKCPSELKTPPRTPSKTIRSLSTITTPTLFRFAGVLHTPPSTHKTPGDRFVPNRAFTNAQFSSYKLGLEKSICSNSSKEGQSESPSDLEWRKTMREKLLALKGRSSESRILAFKQSTVNVSSATKTPGKHEYWSPYSPSRPLSSSARRKARKIPKSAEKVLDAPGLINDFYLNVLDWGRGHVAVGLGNSVYLLNTATGSVDQLCTMDTTSAYISSLRWNASGKYLAVGNSHREVQLWDVNAIKLVRSMRTHRSRVSSLAWEGRTGGLLSSGSQAGHVHNYDTRAARSLVQSLQSHALDVCGLQWSPSGRFLASGGNDNVVNVWDTCSRDPWSAPAFSFKKHAAAVKAVAWCPWQPNLLATGGGASDKSICLWNACSGKLESTLLTGSQISGLMWSSTNQELLSSHGHPHNQLTIWRCCSSPPSLSKVADLKGHEDRVLHLAMSPDGQSVVSAGADETLRFWKCFPKEQDKLKENSTTNSSSSGLSMLQYVR